jgi:ribose/xylose/arabinose/galactoside ABC-type transport system permease subunit
MTSIAIGKSRRISLWTGVLGFTLVSLLVTFSLTNRNFFGGGVGMLSQIQLFLPTGIIAIGIAVVILTGNIDLSAGAVASLASVIAGVAMVSGVNVYLAILLAILVSTAVGFINGLIITLFGINSLLVTLATQFVVGSVAVSMAGDSPPQSFADNFLQFGQGRIGPIPISLVIFLSIAATAAVTVTRTRFGRRLVLIGFNRSAGTYVGIPVTRTLIGVFTMSGLLYGIAGIVLAAYFNAGRADAGLSLLLPAITCVVLGGVDIFGGHGRVGQVVLAVFVLGYLTQGLLNNGVSSLAATMVTGVLLILSLVVKISIEQSSGSLIIIRLCRRLSALVAARRSPGRVDTNDFAPPTVRRITTPTQRNESQ